MNWCTSWASVYWSVCVVGVVIEVMAVSCSLISCGCVCVSWVGNRVFLTSWVWDTSKPKASIWLTRESLIVSSSCHTLCSFSPFWTSVWTYLYWCCGTLLICGLTYIIVCMILQPSKFPVGWLSWWVQDHHMELHFWGLDFGLELLILLQHNGCTYWMFHSIHWLSVL